MKMKSWKKRVLAGTVAGLMLMGTSAFAAEYTKVEAVPTGDENAPVTVTFENDLANTDQMTILVYKLGEAGGTTQITDANIAFIDQFAKEDGTSQLQFYIRSGEGFGPGTYKVLMGGTGVAQARSATFTISDGGTGEKVYEVSGKIGPASEKLNADGFEFIDEQCVYTVELKTSAQGDVLYTGTVSEELVEGTEGNISYNAFNFSNVKNGNYVLAISRPGFISRFVEVIVNDGNVVVPDKRLMFGDVADADGIVGEKNLICDGSDSGPLVDVLDMNAADNPDQYKVVFDYDANGVIDGSDIGALVDSLDKTTLDYGETPDPTV